MSIVDDQNRLANEKHKEECRLAEQDHRIEQARLRRIQDNPKDPLVIEFIARRRYNALQDRKRFAGESAIVAKRRRIR
jgi:hypothetical protein